jgi:hypothetical protein
MMDGSTLLIKAGKFSSPRQMVAGRDSIMRIRMALTLKIIVFILAP